MRYYLRPRTGFGLYLNYHRIDGKQYFDLFIPFFILTMESEE